MLIIENSFCDAYKEALRVLVDEPEFISSPRGFKVHECLNASLVIRNPLSNLFKNSYRGIPLKYLKKEVALYLSARRDAEGFEEASKFWANIKTPDNLINSAYGYLIFEGTKTVNGKTQFEWVIDSLKEDKDSRQAIMFFNKPEFQYEGNKDFVCTLNMIFHIRDNKLYATTNMRSQDIRRGMQFDIPFFTLVQYLVYLELKQVYPELSLGWYRHNCASLHIYDNLVGNESDINLAKNMLKAEWTEDFMPMPKTTKVIKSTCIDSISHGTYSSNNVTSEDAQFYDWLLIK
jgi:thymidylate synthase